MQELWDDFKLGWFNFWWNFHQRRKSLWSDMKDYGELAVIFILGISLMILAVVGSILAFLATIVLYVSLVAAPVILIMYAAKLMFGG